MPNNKYPRYPEARRPKNQPMPAPELEEEYDDAMMPGQNKWLLIISVLFLGVSLLFPELATLLGDRLSKVLCVVAIGIVVLSILATRVDKTVTGFIGDCFCLLIKRKPRKPVVRHYDGDYEVYDGSNDSWENGDFDIYGGEGAFTASATESVQNFPLPGEQSVRVPAADAPAAPAPKPAPAAKSAAKPTAPASKPAATPSVDELKSFRQEYVKKHPEKVAEAINWSDDQWVNAWNEAKKPATPTADDLKRFRQEYVKKHPEKVAEAINWNEAQWLTAWKKGIK